MIKARLEKAAAAFKDGRLAEAQAGYEEVLRLQPRSLNALRMLGRIAGRRRQPRRAMEFAIRAIELNAAIPAAHFELGLALTALNRREDAVRSYERAIELRPDFVEARIHHSTDLVRLGRYADGLASAEKALALRPESDVALNNRGAALIHLGRASEALDCLDKALSVNPDHVSALSNRGAALQLLGRYAEALESCDRALAIKPDNAGAHVNKATLLLRLGELTQGFEEFEWRWRSTGAGVLAHRYGHIPLWAGEPLHGKRILLHAEQGYGDSIQFLRYAPMVRALGAETTVQLPQRLLPLAKDSLENGIRVINAQREVSDVDLQCPLLSLPRAFRTTLGTVPAPVPYLRVDRAAAKAWADKLGSGGKIGLAWAGNKKYIDDSNRSIGLRALLPLLGLDARFVSLQKFISAEDRAVLKGYSNVMDFGDQLGDFAQTAALMENLDLVISVDTYATHLAGALGKQVWVLLPYVPDWRWLLERGDSPWYPTVRLFRQPAAGDWDSVIAVVRSSLAAGLPP
jgi:Flp pilus assembly protein TadD